MHGPRSNIGSSFKPSLNRVSRASANLSNIREESMEMTEDRQTGDDTYHDLRTNDFEDDEDEDDMAEWDEEATLVALLENE